MFGGITALHIERILCQCISMAALKVGNENENEIATCESQCEMLHKYTCMYKFIYVCVCVRVSVRKFIENVCQRRRKENMGGRD